MRWKIAVCEDDPLFRENLCNMLLKWTKDHGITLSLHAFETTLQLLAAVEDANSFDAYFLDIETPSPMSGLELADAIREVTTEAPIVFVTSYHEFASRGYFSNALNYLVKPVNEAMLFPVLERVAAKLEQQKGYIFYIKIENELRQFRYSDIYCFHSEGHYIVINEVTNLRFREKIGDLMKTLPKQFVRIHQSTVINLEHLYRMKPNSVVLDDKYRTELSVSSRYRDQLREAVHAHLSNYLPMPVQPKPYSAEEPLFFDRGQGDKSP